jgi:CDP-diacylglycerol---glycerol-3-phosphate 3-phosphatidyltransferase
MPADAPGQGSPPTEGTSPPRPGLVNIANVLTVVRILLVPVFVVCLFAGGTGWRLAALATFVVASVTDLLDGQLARSRGLVTDFGKIADPIADKALTGAALISLSVLGELPGWVTALILIREVGVTVLRFVVIRRGVIAASQGGKLKTLLQVAAICLYVLPASLSPPAPVREVVMAVAVVVTLVTGADYVVRAARLYRGPAAPGPVPGPGTPGTSGTSGTNGAHGTKGANSTNGGNGGGADG